MNAAEWILAGFFHLVRCFAVNDVQSELIQCFKWIPGFKWLAASGKDFILSQGVIMKVQG